MDIDHFVIQVKFYMSHGYDEISANYMSSYAYGTIDPSDRVSMKHALNDIYRQYTLKYVKKQYDQDLIGNICHVIHQYIDGKVFMSEQQMQSGIALLVLQNE